MNKVLGIAVVAGALLPSMASAEATLYGKVKLFAAQHDNGTTERWELSSESSRFGVKGSSELENDLKLVYQLEYEIDPAVGSGIGVKKDSTGDEEVKARNQYLGLNGGFGTVVLGRHDTPLKKSQGKVDLFSDYEEADMKHVIGGENRVSGIAYYKSPSMGGVELHAAIVPGQGNDFDGGGQLEEGLADATSLAVTFNNGPLYLALAHDTDIQGNTSGGESDVTRLSAQYKMGVVRVGALYQAEDLAGTDFNSYLVSAGFQITDSAEVKVQHVTREADVVGSPEDVQSTLGVDYALGDNTTVVAYLTSRESGTAELDLYGLGLMHNF